MRAAVGVAAAMWRASFGPVNRGGWLGCSLCLPIAAGPRGWPRSASYHPPGGEGVRLATRKRGSSAAWGAVVRTPGSVLRSGGRVVLWCALGLLLVRGAGDVLAAKPSDDRPRAARAVSASWPDDETRAFAVGFARAYLTFSPPDPEGYARAVQGLVAPELRATVVPQLPAHGAGQSVQDAI